MKRVATAVLIISSVLLPAVILVRAAPARAADTPLAATGSPVQTAAAVPVAPVGVAFAVPVSTRSLTLSGTVPAGAPALASTAAGASSHSYSLWFRYPKSDAAVQVGRLTAGHAGSFTVAARLDAARITMGVNAIQVQSGDGSTFTATGDGAVKQQLWLDIRRVSRVSLTQLESSDGVLALAVRVSHYDPKTSRFIASRLSPVKLQEQVAGRWITRTTVVTDTYGVAGALIEASTGPRTFRAVRPNGATVWAATSAAISLSCPCLSAS